MKKILNSKAVRVIFFIAMALWGLLQAVEAFVSLPQISDFFSDYVLWRHELISDQVSGVIGLIFALSALFMLGRETKRETPRKWSVSRAVIFASAGVALMLSVFFYAAVFGSLSELPFFGIGEARVVKVPMREGRGASGSHASGGAADRPNGESGPGPGATAKSSQNAPGPPVARQSRAKSSCGCRFSGGTHSERSEESWESPEPEWEEAEEPEWEEPEEPEWEEPEWEEPEEPSWESREPEWEEPEWEEPEWE
jgi:hypothetical protein